ncbi:asparagine synthase [Massilia glaciei]|uniref:asparagine synthase (glutamine-hydrolyzing) n=2 Tax=Massilia glaciei TaxID=1524097 RepID=A0A2U2HK78_9BURK|nr:asparagine synthase [Massilia glaciei]
MRGARFTTAGSASRTLGHRVGGADGVFAHWTWVGQRLTAGNDRHGFYPLFYASWDGSFAISPSIDRLLALGAPAMLDTRALSVFLRLGFFIGEDTPFEHIRAMPPGAVLEWDGALRIAKVAPSPTARHDQLARDEAIDTYIALFRAALERRAPGGQFVVPLSGGRDSRHILFELLRQGHRPYHCLTTAHYPPRGGEDVRVAANLARGLGLPHVVLAQRQSWFAAERRKNPLTSFCSDEHAWYMVAADHLNARPDLGVYDGIGGDVLSAGLFVTARRRALFEAGDPRAIAAHLLNADETVLARLLAPAFQRDVGRERALEHLGNELAKHLGRPNPVGAFYFANRTRREIALVPYGLLGAMPQVFSPYLDHALVDFLGALPLAMLADGAFHNDTIARAYPQFAHIGYEEKDGPAADARACRAGFGRELARELLGCAPSTLLNQRFLRPRLCAGALTDKWAAASHWYAAMALYLHQLDAAATRPIP